jgi:hypothetical protein
MVYPLSYGSSLGANNRKGTRVKQEKIVSEQNRKIVSTYTLENNYRVKLSTYHSSTSKVIHTILSECITGTSGIFTMETFMMYRDYNARVISEPVARYSFKALQDQHERAIEQAAQQIAYLLAEGEANERECQKLEAA